LRPAVGFNDSGARKHTHHHINFIIDVLGNYVAGPPSEQRAIEVFHFSSPNRTRDIAAGCFRNVDEL
jgi:hypothetical protein